jgi:Flp pilus assembly CpaF family ATPase
MSSTSPNTPTPADVDLASLPFFTTDTPEPENTTYGAAPQTTSWAKNSTTAPTAFNHLRTTGTTPTPVDSDPVLIGQTTSDGAPVFMDPLPVQGSAHWADEKIWAIAEELITVAGDRQAQAESDTTAALDEEARQERGRAIIAEVVRDYASDVTAEQGQTATPDLPTQDSLRQTLFDAIFRLGRLQPLIDDETIENIHLIGTRAFVQRVGSLDLSEVDPVVHSDTELKELIDRFSRSKGEGARNFSASTPSLHLDLPAGQWRVRLHATMPPLTQHVEAIIRVHRYLDVSLDDLVANDTLTDAAAHFLTTAVKAGRSAVAGGVPGDGKTTLIRALCDAINPAAQIVTVETERELHLDLLSSRVVPPKAYEYIPAGETGTGERTLSMAVNDGLRDNARYIIVGEVRGDEIGPMVRAMQVGVGTLSTTHANDPHDCIQALVGLGEQTYGHDYMSAQLGRNLDLIVQLGFVDVPGAGAVRRVTHISEVIPTADGTSHVSTQDLFHLDPTAGDTQARFLRLPESPVLRQKLVRAGLDEARLEAGR